MRKDRNQQNPDDFGGEETRRDWRQYGEKKGRPYYDDPNHKQRSAQNREQAKQEGKPTSTDS